MKFGIFLQPVHEPSEHPTVALERDLDLMVHLDKLGYDEAWIGEHHSTGWENIGAPDVFIAAAAERTKNLRFGTGIIQLGLHHPLVILDRMIFLDHLTRGRASFGFGVGGGLPSDLTVFGLTKESAGKRLGESVDVMFRLLESDEPITERTDWYELHNAVLQVRPYSQPHMPMAMATMQPQNLELMGRVGGTVLTGPLPHLVGDMHAHMQRGAASVGAAASRDQIMLNYGLHIADTRAQALDEIRDAAIREYREFDVAVNGQGDPDATDDEIIERIERNWLLGNPDQVAEQLDGLVERSDGGFGGIVFLSRDWAGRDAAWRTWELFARHVAPRYQGHIGAQARAAQAAGELNS